MVTTVLKLVCPRCAKVRQTAAIFDLPLSKVDVNCCSKQVVEIRPLKEKDGMRFWTIDWVKK